jgi:ABC-type glycerol-3-phosphate transport system permease component
MRKRVLGILLTLCLLLVLLPSTALAVPVYRLYVGDTLVFDYASDSPESTWEAGTTYYWKDAVAAMMPMPRQAMQTITCSL